VAELFPIQHSYLIPLLPLVGAFVCLFFGKKVLKGQAHWPIWLTVGASAVLSIWILVAMLGMAHDNPSGTLSYTKTFYTWIDTGSFRADVAFFFDPLTAVMLTVVCGIGFFITVFAAGYMKGEEGYARFFAYLGMFIFAMTCLVLGDNLVMLYLGWEGVGLCSYLLIGYYYQKPSARDAAKKAFIVNRIGDFGFGLGIMLAFLAFGTVSYFGTGGDPTDGLLEMASSGTLGSFQILALMWLPFLLMLGAFGKSAQFPLYVWLPDAMEGPTPVSALIHAATMVTAGVYMIARCGTLFVGNQAAMITVAAVGAFTALFAGSIALRQFDLKKVFAYSTVSQLGFMFVAVGVLAPVAGVFHLVTHAFFKALLFLSSGVVMHAMLGHLDMRQMSGLKHVLPTTRWLILIGCLALAGFPFLSGFFSKDEIVAAGWHASPVLGSVLLLTAFLTAYYTFRLYFRVFEGPKVVPDHPHPDHHGADHHGHDDHGHGSHGHDSHHGHSHEPFLMIFPLLVLAIGALVAGYINFPKHHLGHFLGQSPSFSGSYALASGVYNPGSPDHPVNPVGFGLADTRPEALQKADHTAHVRFMILSGVIALAGIGLAWALHLRDRSRADALAARLAPVARAMENKYWVDEAYDAAIVQPMRESGKAMFAFDRFGIDGLVWLVSFIPQIGGFVLKVFTQRGYLQGYAMGMVVGLAVILLWMMM
jgi:NADH-quinone oxidoreductase subunit L